MERHPLNNSEMRDILMDLLYGKDFKDDHERAHFCAGMKLGLITATTIPEQDELIRMVDMVFMFQKTFDPDGNTWDKEAANAETQTS